MSKDRENDLIIDLMKDMRKESREHAKNSANHREESNIWQSNTDHRLENIEVDLRDHKEGVIQNRESIGTFHTRLELLEAPTKAKQYLYKKYMKVGGFVSLTISIIAGITKILGLW